MIAIGVYFLKGASAQGMRDYFLGGRKMNPYVTAMSAQASDMSGWLLMGLPGAIVLMGMGEAWIGIGLAIGSYLCWLFAAKRLRKHSVVSGDAITMPEFFSNRYHDDKGYLRLISTLIIIFFFTIYVASGFKSCGYVLEEAIGIPLTWAIIVGVVISIAYTIMGGYTAVCWADFVQALLMIVCVVIVPIAAISSMGGWGDTVSAIDGLGIEGFTNLFYDGGEKMSVIAILSALSWGFGYFGMPHIVVRYMSIRDPNEIKVARRISLIWIVIALSSVVLMAIVGRAYFAQQGLVPGTDYDPEHIFLDLAGAVFFPFLCGVVYAAILAAIMSTADSQLLVATSSITNDILAKSKRFRYGDRELTWISRGAVILISIVATVIAIFDSKNIMDLVSYAWSGFGSAFGPVMILSLFWKRMNLQGSVASMISGFFFVVIWTMFFETSTGVYSLLPGFFVALFVGIGVALLTEPPSEEIQCEFDLAQVYEESASEDAAE